MGRYWHRVSSMKTMGLSVALKSRLLRSAGLLTAAAWKQMPVKMRVIAADRSALGGRR